MRGLSPQETVERALAAAKSGDCVVIAEETSTANLRWAGNTLTTNGVAGSRQLTVIAIDRRAAGSGPGNGPGNGQGHPDRGEVHRDRQVPGRRRALPVQPVARVDRPWGFGGTGSPPESRGGLGGIVPPD